MTSKASSRSMCTPSQMHRRSRRAASSTSVKSRTASRCGASQRPSGLKHTDAALLSMTICSTLEHSPPVFLKPALLRRCRLLPVYLASALLQQTKCLTVTERSHSHTILRPLMCDVDVVCQSVC